MTRVLITGAGGFAGHHFLEHVLATTDWYVAATDSFRHKGKTDRIAEVLEGHDQVAALRPWWSERTQVMTHDLTAPFSVQAASDLEDTDYIVAFASESHVDRSITDPVPFFMNNCAVALNTLELARKVRPRAFVLVSTDEVYGPVEEHNPPFREWARTLPSNPYSASKAAQEAAAISYWRTYGVPVVIVNCMNMIGERQDAEKFIPKTLRNIMKGRTVAIHGTPGHIGTRHYLHARNLADGIIYVLNERVLYDHPFRLGYDRPPRYNIASPDRVSNLEMAQMIASYAGLPWKYELEDFHATRPGHDPHYGLDPAKMERLGWTPPVPLGESLEKTVKWTMENRRWLLDD